ncbi:hypothetical protein [Bifidobacterium pseudolongum]|uniref:hypothetical protein n=1 Tax=Bifidobacterium pseudolongum TaxID=1694 RepID=UPI0010219689|nr:hypothetical protein [Bifidobacterium pseudolongum]
MNWTPFCCAGESAAAIFVGDPPLRSLFSLFSSLFGLIYDENSENSDGNGESEEKQGCVVCWRVINVLGV